ncbi:MAG: ATP-dependent RNA helicase HrpA, partial [Chromatiales bacterium]
MHDEHRFPDDSLIDDCLLADRHAFRKRLGGLKRRLKQKQPVDPGLEKLEKAIAESLQTVAVRRELAQEIDFPPDLPISGSLHQIRETIAANQVVILCGETGSGKSTQLPKICLSMGMGTHGRIGHTQPRRIAARSLMSRISTELETEPGTLVGYKVRFKDHVRPQTRVKLMTDGILLAEIQRDAWLNEYDTLIIDEAHERSLNIDFLIGYLKQLIKRRSDLKIIITSATIDPQRFSRHFDNVPVIEVSGRTYPVELRYRPLEEEGVSERDEAMQLAIVDAVDELSREDSGDVLIFLSGEREIRETAETLRKHKLQATEVLPLYARLSPADQARIFRSSGKRRIVLATNVAETSLTVPGIRHVIDTGFARISRYSHRSKVQRLPVEFISQASANQRKGRCGRVAEGICIRLYSEEQFESRRPFTEPEIQRTNLASVILQMKLLRFGDIATFPFIDPPDKRLVRDGYRLLEEIGAVDGERSVTRIGRQLARLPVDPRVGRMLLEAAHGSCLRELLVIAAALSIQDPRDRPLDKQQAADEAHRLFHDEHSDFGAYVNLWKHLEEQRHHLTRRKFIR